MPIILKVGLQDLVSVVILHSHVLLTKTGNPAEQEISECIPGRKPRIGVVKGEESRNTARRELAAQLVLLCRNGIGPKLEIVPAYDFGDIVTICVRGVRVVDSVRNVTGVLSEASPISGSHEIDSRQYTEAISRKDVRCRETGETRSLPATDVVEDDVIRRITEHEFIQQSRREG